MSSIASVIWSCAGGAPALAPVLAPGRADADAIGPCPECVVCVGADPPALGPPGLAPSLAPPATCDVVLVAVPAAPDDPELVVDAAAGATTGLGTDVWGPEV